VLRGWIFFGTILAIFFWTTLIQSARDEPFGSAARAGEQHRPAIRISETSLFNIGHPFSLRISE
jgi:hypothetical protein